MANKGTRMAMFIITNAEDNEHIAQLASTAADTIRPLGKKTVYYFEDGSELTINEDGTSEAAA